MHLDSANVVDIQLVQVTFPSHGLNVSKICGHFRICNVHDCINVLQKQSSEVGGSLHMEKEGLKRGLDHLEENNVNVKYIVTKRRTQVQKFLRERGVTQCYDVCHLEKGKY